MRSLYRWLGALSLLVGLGVGVCYPAGVADLMDLCTGSNQSNCPFKIDSSGNVTTTGSVTTVGVTNTGASTVTGASTITGALTQSGGAVKLSSTSFSGGAALWSQTLAQLQGLTATTTGQVVYCSNCVQSAVCISTGSTAANQYVVVGGTSTVGGALMACR